MKKIVALIAIVGTAMLAYGQGYVNFSNGASTAVSTNATLDILGNSTGSGTTGSMANSSSGQTYYFALLMQTWSGTTASATTSTLLSSGWVFTGNYATNGLALGRFGGGTDVPTSAGDAIGISNQFVVVGWSSALGNNWLTVSNELATGTWQNNGFFGVSIVGIGVGAPPPTATAETLFGSSPAINTGFVMFAVPVPEPTTIALAGLGGLSLLLFRRRK